MAVVAVMFLSGRLDGGEAILAAGFVAMVTALALMTSQRAVERQEAFLAVTSERANEPPPYPTLINALPDPVLVISATEPDDLTSRRYIFANAAARDLLRIELAEGLLVSAIRDPQVLQAVDDALFQGNDAEAVFETPGVQERILRVYARPLGLALDGRRQAILVFRDETEFHRVERTRVDFLANASHELRTPLASLSGFIETLRGHAKEDAGARERFLGIMQSQAERMRRLIDDLLSLSRIELNEHIAPSERVDLAAAVMDVVDAVTPLARERGVTLDTRLPLRGALVVGDRDQLVQVVQNLVDNALKYSRDGGVIRIAVSEGLAAEAAAAPRRPDAARLALLTPDLPQGPYAALVVSDEGPGIAREKLPRLTERFYRVEGQKSGERSGTGLGLAIVKHIANRHRGGLAVESGEGKGTTFTAYFPQVPASAAPAQPGVVAKVS
jgi:two-component system phosphate regulon sensor histidine kinase PhoR